MNGSRRDVSTEEHQMQIPESPGDFVEPSVEDHDLATNLEWNRQRWGQKGGWQIQDQYGYRWGRGSQQTVGQVAQLADEFFRPHTTGRYDLRILELAPGGGRFTAELLRYASTMCLVDLNNASLEVCRERFDFVPTPMSYALTDGHSFDAVPESAEWDAVVSFDSMVHMHPEVIRQYVAKLPGLMAPSGFAWLDHSGKGLRAEGHRTDMTDKLMVEFAEAAGLSVISQRYRNQWDCISVLSGPNGHRP